MTSLDYFLKCFHVLRELICDFCASDLNPVIFFHDSSRFLISFFIAFAILDQKDWLDHFKKRGRGKKNGPQLCLKFCKNVLFLKWQVHFHRLLLWTERKRKEMMDFWIYVSIFVYSHLNLDRTCCCELKGFSNGDPLALLHA